MWCMMVLTYKSHLSLIPIQFIHKKKKKVFCLGMGLYNYIVTPPLPSSLVHLHALVIPPIAGEMLKISQGICLSIQQWWNVEEMSAWWRMRARQGVWVTYPPAHVEEGHACKLHSYVDVTLYPHYVANEYSTWNRDINAIKIHFQTTMFNLGICLYFKSFCEHPETRIWLSLVPFHLIKIKMCHFAYSTENSF